VLTIFAAKIPSVIIEFIVIVHHEFQTGLP
jgi:hypothetical protein